MSINTLQTILNQAANALQLYPADSLWIKLIPAVISVFNELILFSDAKDVEERLAELETRVESMGIEQQQFSDLVNGLSSHLELPQAFEVPWSMVVMAARMNGILPIDTPYPDLENQEGFIAEERKARASGFAGVLL